MSKKDKIVDLSTMEFYSPKQVSEKLQISTDSVYALLRAGSLKGFKVGRQYRISKSSLNEFLQACA